MTEYLQNTTTEGNVTVAKDWRFFLELYCRSNSFRSSETRRSYRKWLTCYFTWMDETGRNINSMRSMDIITYMDHLQALIRDGRCTASTANAYLTAIRSFYKWASRNEMYPNIAADVKSLWKGKQFIKMHLTQEQSANLLRTSKARSIRDFAMENMMLRLGLRTVEVARLNISSIRDRKGARVVYVHGKGHSEADSYVVMSDMVYAPIREYLDTRKECDANAPLFVSESPRSRGRRLSTRAIQSIVKTDLRSIGLDSREYSPHSLRHTTGVMIIENGGTPIDVQKVLRHADVKTSEIYLMSIEDDQHIKNAPERLLDNCFNI